MTTNRVSLLLFLLSSVGAFAAPAIDEEDTFDAILLYGSGGIATWTQNFNENLRDEMGAELSQHFTPEFLSLISANRDDRDLIARSLALKYSDREIDLVVAMLTQANSFVHEFGEVFAPNAARLYVLPGPDIKLNSDKHAVVESAFNAASRKTIELIPQILPNVERLYVVSGAGPGDQSYLRRYKNVAADSDSDLDIFYISGLPPEDLVTELGLAPRNSAVVMTTYDVDNTGLLLQSHYMTALISERLDIPVFGMTDTHAPVGAVGGNVTTTSAYARSTAKVIRDIVAGDFPDAPVTAGTEYVFNGQQLDRFRVNRNLLPADAIIVNETPNLWRDYPGWIALGVGIIVFQLGLIGLMLNARRRSRIAEEALQRSHKMEAMGTLAGGIAHDFNNILMSIVANAELASLQLNDEKAVKDSLNNIQSASDRASHLVSQILMFSRQSQQHELKSVQLDALMNESIDHIRPLLADNCTIEYEGTPQELFIDADANQLQQVFMNLSVNAQHAMDGKGVINIFAGKVEVQDRENFLGQGIPPGEYIEIRFVDTGSGIEPGDLRHVFEPFFSTKPMGKGTGLGLALVYQIIKSHGGYIDIKSSPGEGTTVTLFLSGSTPRQNADVSRPGTIFQGQNQHILLVDDDSMVLDANRENLLALGYRVTAFNSSTAALEHFSENAQQFDLLLTDLSMPEMDGVRLISNVRQIRPDLPVILCTGYLDALQSSDLEDLQLIKKPFSRPEISEALHTALRREHQA